MSPSTFDHINSLIMASLTRSTFAASSPSHPAAPDDSSRKRALPAPDADDRDVKRHVTLPVAVAPEEGAASTAAEAPDTGPPPSAAEAPTDG